MFLFSPSMTLYVFNILILYVYINVYMLFFPNHQIHIDIPRMSPESLILQPKVTEVRGQMDLPE